MFQLVEITGVMNEKNGIEVPAALLSQTGIKNGEEVKLIYLAAGEKDFRNELNRSSKLSFNDSRGYSPFRSSTKK